MRRRLCLALAVLVLASSASADQPFWTFEVVDVADEGEDAHTIRLIPMPPGPQYPRRCQVFVIHAQYRPGVGVAPYMASLFTPQAYDKAIQRLRQAQIENQLARVGSLDLGFGKIDEAPECEVASAGLAILTYETGMPAVYSVY